MSGHLFALTATMNSFSLIFTTGFALLFVNYFHNTRIWLTLFYHFIAFSISLLFDFFKLRFAIYDV